MKKILRSIFLVFSISVVAAILGMVISGKNSAELTISILRSIKNLRGSESLRFDELNEETEPAVHEQWDILLKKYVNTDGNVDYKGFKTDSVLLDSYLEELSGHPPGINWSEAEKKAYWINTYNAFTIKLILDYYPVTSIKEIAGSVPFINSPWDIKFFKIGDNLTDLNTIEHEILRKKFNDPRIHFAINCASVSCPNLRNEAYNASRLDMQLNEQAIEFINDATKNNVSGSSVKLSMVFYWFQGDFEIDSTLLTYLNQFATVQADEDASIEYLEYDWALNE